jgi:hypothetical protein
MSMRAKRIFIVPAALVALLAAGYCVLWVVVAHWIEGGFLNWARVQAAHGNTVEHGALALAGFPGPIRMTIPAPRVTSTNGGWQWSAERTVLETRPWAWRRFRLELFGDQQVAVPFAGKLHRYTLRPASALIVGEADAMGQLSQGALRARDVTVREPSGSTLLSVQRVQGHLNLRTPGATAENQKALDLTLHGEDVELGPMFQTPLGKAIQGIGLVAAVKGTMPQTFLRESMDAWRASGGAVDLNHFQINWGDLALRANGTLALDEMFRPLGALSADIKGYAETLKALQRARVLRRRDADGARLALDLISKRDGTDNRRMVSIPISAQGGMLYLGPVRLLKLAPIPFPVRPD